MPLTTHLKWRYATKKFDATKKVSQEHIDYIQEAVQLSASSYGLQPFKVLDIKDPKLRAELKPLSWNQSQITKASHLFLFCSSTKVSDKDVDHLITLNSEINNIPLENLSGYGDFIKGKMAEKSEDEMLHWTAKQSYIALANALNACAELGIDATPMEGFDAEAYNKTLKLKEKGLNASVVLAIGYRHDDDAAQHAKKVRKPINSLFETL